MLCGSSPVISAENKAESLLKKVGNPWPRGYNYHWNIYRHMAL